LVVESERFSTKSSISQQNMIHIQITTTQITFTHRTYPKLQLQFECRKLAKDQHYCLITFPKDYEETIKQQYPEIFKSDIKVDNKFEATMSKGKNCFRRSPFKSCLSKIQYSLPFFVALN